MINEEVSVVFLFSFLQEIIPINTNNIIPIFFINLKLLRVKDTKPQQHLFCTFVKNFSHGFIIGTQHKKPRGK